MSRVAWLKWLILLLTLHYTQIVNICRGNKPTLGVLSCDCVDSNLSAVCHVNISLASYAPLLGFCYVSSETSGNPYSPHKYQTENIQTQHLLRSSVCFRKRRTNQRLGAKSEVFSDDVIWQLAVAYHGCRTGEANGAQQVTRKKRLLRGMAGGRSALLLE